MPTQKPRLSDAMGSDTVSIIVGKKRKEFIVHKKLICDAGKFFNDAFNGPFKEGQEGIMYMPEDDPDVISIFVDWLYRNPLPMVVDNEKSPKKPTIFKKAAKHPEFGPPTEAQHKKKVLQEIQEKRDAEREKNEQQARLDRQIQLLYRVYFFAEKFFINELKNRAMDRIRNGMCKYNRYIGIFDYRLIYTNTAKDSPLRKFCAKVFVYELAYAQDKTLDKLAAVEVQVPELARDLLGLFRELAEVDFNIKEDSFHEGQLETPDPRQDNCSCMGGEPSCRFHDHSDGEEGCHNKVESHRLCDTCFG